jgi:hypothetical protein
VLFIRTSARFMSAVTGRISIKFGTGVCAESCWANFVSFRNELISV